MTDGTPSRRRVLARVGGTVTAGLAGCLDRSDAPAVGSSDDENGEEDDGPDGNHDHDDSNGDHDHDDGHELGHPEAQIDIAMESDDDGNHFVPHIVHVEEGGTVTWILESGAHDTVAYHPDNTALLPSATERRLPEGARPWASELYRTEGSTFERTFDETGIYDYACSVVEHGHGPDRGHGHGPHRTHEATGMVGRVIVGWPEPDPETQPALRSPGEQLPDAARDELRAFNDQTRAALDHGGT